METLKQTPAIVSQFNLQSRLYNNTLDGIGKAESLKRISEEGNHITWLAGHLLSTRYQLANSMGIMDQDEWKDLLDMEKVLATK